MARSSILPLAVLAALVAIVSGSAAVLTEDNFDVETADTSTFVKFFAPWCGHCVKLSPTWDSLAEHMKASGKGKAVKVDCTVDSGLCNKFNVRGYPTLIFITKSGDKVPFQGQRTEEALTQFFENQIKEI